MRAAKDPVVRLDAVSDPPAAAVLTDGRERMDRALKAVEDVRLAAAVNLERLVYSLPQTSQVATPLLPLGQVGLEISSTVSPTFFSFASSATSACVSQVLLGLNGHQFP